MNYFQVQLWLWQLTSTLNTLKLFHSMIRVWLLPLFLYWWLVLNSVKECTAARYCILWNDVIGVENMKGEIMKFFSSSSGVKNNDLFFDIFKISIRTEKFWRKVGNTLNKFLDILKGNFATFLRQFLEKLGKNYPKNRKLFWENFEICGKMQLHRKEQINMILLKKVDINFQWRMW